MKLNWITKASEAIKAWIREERRWKERRLEYERDMAEAQARKCAGCRTRECLWTSGYCPN